MRVATQQNISLAAGDATVKTNKTKLDAYKTEKHLRQLNKLILTSVNIIDSLRSKLNTNEQVLSSLIKDECAYQAVLDELINKAQSEKIV